MTSPNDSFDNALALPLPKEKWSWQEDPASPEVTEVDLCPEARRPELEHPFSFSGSGREYFRIWIVNVLLSLLTLGIYSAWAKVRSKRYFYGHTRLQESGFDYHGDPIKILKGRLIAAAIFGAYFLLSQATPLAGLIFLPIFAFAFPWMLVSSMAFNLRNSSYRNVRFGFDGSYREALKTFGLMYLVVPLTLGLALPHVLHSQKRFQVEHSAYGTARFSFGATVGDYWRLVGKIALVGLAGLVALVLGCTAILALLQALGVAQQEESPLATILGLGCSAVAYLFIVVYAAVKTINLVWGQVTLDGAYSFRSRMKVAEAIKLYGGNLLMVVLSLGLLVPWAAVRATRFRLARLTIVTRRDFGSFQADLNKPVGALGQELGDAFDFDMGM